MMVEGRAMRTFLLAAAIASGLASPALGETRHFGITGFTKVRVDGPYVVKLRTGIAPFASATGPAAALDRLSIAVRGDTLIVAPDASGWGGYPGKDPGRVTVELGTHEMSAAWVNGAGALDIDKVQGLSFTLSVQGSGSGTIDQVAVDQFSVGVMGTANASLAGRAAKLTAIVRGISSVDARQLAAKDATLAAEGAATIKASVSNSAKINASGPAMVTLSGGAACNVTASGAASVSGCR
jgi:hypothetical protein